MAIATNQHFWHLEGNVCFTSLRMLMFHSLNYKPNNASSGFKLKSGIHQIMTCSEPHLNCQWLPPWSLLRDPQLDPLLGHSLILCSVLVNSQLSFLYLSEKLFKINHNYYLLIIKYLIPMSSIGGLVKFHSRSVIQQSMSLFSPPSQI